MNELKMPHDGKLEATVIGSLFYEPEIIYEIEDLLTPHIFYFTNHQKIIKKVMELAKEDVMKINFVEISPFLQKEGIKPQYLYKLTESIASVKPIRYHVQRLHDLSILRKAIQIGFQLTDLYGLREGREIREALSSITKQFETIHDMSVQHNNMKVVSEILSQYAVEYEELSKNSTGITGVPSGFLTLDRLTGGFQKGDLIIFGARPSMGKTAFACQIAEHASVKKKEVTAFFSLEMVESKIVQRMVSSMGRINLQMLNRGLLNDVNKKKHVEAMGLLNNASLYIDDESHNTVQMMKAKARKLKREKGLSLILIDYLQFITPEDKRASRYEQVSKIAKDLKFMAKELQVPVICLSQLSRQVEERKDKRPMMSDLKESGEIEQSADIVGFLYRDEYYNKNTKSPNTAELNIAKQRNGPTDTLKFRYVKEVTRFHEMG